MNYQALIAKVEQVQDEAFRNDDVSGFLDAYEDIKRYEDMARTQAVVL